MTATFALQRKDILEHNCDLKTLLEKYPFLGCAEWVCQHLDVITLL